MAKKITLKNKNGDVLCPHTAIEQVQGLKEALDGKLGKTDKVSSAINADKLGGHSSSLYLKGTGILESADFNEQKTIGIYRYNGVSDKNAPSEATAYGNLMVIRSGEHDTLTQLYFNFLNNRIFVRSGDKLGFASRDWQTIAFTDSTVASVIDGAISTSKIADTAITPAKIQTSIALNGTPSMTVEPTLSSTSQTIASVGLVKNLKIDTRNLLTNSKEITIDGSSLTSGSKYITKKLPISVAVGDVLTFNCEDMIINAGTDQTHAILLYSGGALASVKYISPTSKTATITVTKASSTPYLYMYAGYSDDSAGKSITYKGATLVKGDKPMLLWQRAVEDLDDVANYTVMPNLISASDFELGGLNDSAGANYDSVTRVRTKNYIPVSAPKITLKSWTDGVVFYLWSYDTNKNPIQMSYSSTNWVSSTKYTYTLPTGTAYIRVVMKKTSGANFTVAELPTIKIKAENGSKATAWQPSADDMQVSRPTVYYQSSQPANAVNGDIWIIS